jgi:hypothetical protein
VCDNPQITDTMRYTVTELGYTTYCVTQGDIKDIAENEIGQLLLAFRQTDDEEKVKESFLGTRKRYGETEWSCLLEKVAIDIKTYIAFAVQNGYLSPVSPP